MKRTKNALLIVDIQKDFLPGGALACPKGDEIIDPIVTLSQSDFFDFVVVSKDIHPENHISFVTEHPGHKPFDVIQLYNHVQILWPKHCIAGTRGVELAKEIEQLPSDMLLVKGTNPKVDAYSLFMDNYNERGTRQRSALTAYLRNAGVENVYVCGLARNICVLWTAIDGRTEGFKTHLVWDLTRPTDPNTDSDTKEICHNKHIEIVYSKDILNAV